MPSSAGPNNPGAALAEALENSVRVIDRHLQDDRCFPDLSELLSIPSHSKLPLLEAKAPPCSGRDSKVACTCW